MITIATLLWDHNDHSESFSRCYSEIWVDRLYRQVARNLTVPFRFVCFVDRGRRFKETNIEQMAFQRVGLQRYASCIEPFRLGVPMILMGLDTVILRNIDHLAAWCLTADSALALPRDPYNTKQACNGVCLVGDGREAIYDDHRGENDMEWLRKQPHVFIDEIFGERSVVSYKGYIQGQTAIAMSGGTAPAEPHSFVGVDICFMHGRPKQHELQDVPEIKDAWR